MSEPEHPDHITHLGDLPDYIEEAEKLAQQSYESCLKRVWQDWEKSGKELRAGHVVEAAKASLIANALFFGGPALIAGKDAVKFVLQTDTFDMLRLGDSLLRPTWQNIVKDVLRLLNVLPIAGKFLSVFREGMVVTQKPGVSNCVFVALNNGLAETGQGFLRNTGEGRKLFLTIERIAEASEIDLGKIGYEGGTVAQQFEEITKTLAKVGVAFEKIPRPMEELERGIQVLEDIGKANPKGTLIIHVRYGKRILVNGLLTREFGHTMSARYVGKTLMVSTNYARGGVRELIPLAELPKYYPDPVLSPDFQTIFLKNTWLVQAFESPLLNIFFPAVLIGVNQGQRVDKQAFASPPRGNSAFNRRPLGIA
jgi:hypothetical protein